MVSVMNAFFFLLVSLLVEKACSFAATASLCDFYCIETFVLKVVVRPYSKISRKSVAILYF